MSAITILRKALLAMAVVVLALAGIAGILYVTNGTPQVPAVSAADIEASGRPVIVKLHAQWCPICMVTKGVWSDIEQAYAGRANLVVWDFTDAATTAASDDDAKRLGLGGVFKEYSGVTGLVLVIDSVTKTVVGEAGGVETAGYRSTIDAVLAGERPGG